MNGDDRVRLGYDPARRTAHTIEGVVQRVDYIRRELAVVAEGRAWRFAVPPECQLWFNDAPALLRCFHPLDPVTVIFRDSGGRRVVDALYYREPAALQKRGAPSTHVEDAPPCLVDDA